MLRFTYIIAYRHSADRLNNLKTVLKWISKANCEIILVESDVESKVSTLLTDFNLKHIFIENKLPFNKSWCFNVGFKAASTDNIVFGDADLIMADNALVDAVNLLADYECVNPYNSVIDLTDIETINFLKTEDFTQLIGINRKGRGEDDHQKVPTCGGIILFRKEALEKVAGWNEDFWGWGGEDDYMSTIVNIFLTSTNLTNKCYHLYHAKAQVIHDYYMRNLHVFNMFINASKEQISQYIEVVKNKIGNINKI